MQQITPNIGGVQKQVSKAVSSFDIKKHWGYLIGVLLVVLAGVGSGTLISQKLLGTKVSDLSTGAAPGAKVTSTEAGLLDATTKYDEAIGDLKEDGIGNEGTHHLERDGGPSRYVYLTSSVIDLQSFVGKKVQVWGQTLASKKAGWLMDVSKIKVVQ